MFFVLSKTFDILLSPLSWVMAAVALAVAGRWMRARAQQGRPVWPKPGGRAARRLSALDRWALPVSLVLLCGFSLEPVSNQLVRSLERGAPSTMRQGHVYDAVVLLGGMIDERVDLPIGPLPRTAFNDNVERLHATHAILAGGHARFAILSGASWASEHAPEAEVMAEELVRLGIARERLLLEGRSRNTRENAEFSAEIVRERGFSSLLLVTSAFHMQRSLECFTDVGLSPDTFPVDYKSYDPNVDAGSWLPRTRSLHDSSYALREWVGRVVYRVTRR